MSYRCPVTPVPVCGYTALYVMYIAGRGWGAVCGGTPEKQGRRGRRGRSRTGDPLGRLYDYYEGSAQRRARGRVTPTAKSVGGVGRMSAAVESRDKAVCSTLYFTLSYRTYSYNRRSGPACLALPVALGSAGAAPAAESKDFHLRLKLLKILS